MQPHERLWCVRCHLSSGCGQPSPGRSWRYRMYFVDSPSNGWQIQRRERDRWEVVSWLFMAWKRIYAVYGQACDNGQPSGSLEKQDLCQKISGESPIPPKKGNRFCATEAIRVPASARRVDDRQLSAIKHRSSISNGVALNVTHRSRLGRYRTELRIGSSCSGNRTRPYANPIPWSWLRRCTRFDQRVIPGVWPFVKYRDARDSSGRINGCWRHARGTRMEGSCV